MHSFVNEWADEFSQINDAIQDKASESMKSIKANQMRMSTVFRGNNINDKKLAELMSWDFDILDTKIEQLIVHAFTIFDTWCTSDATPTETPAANPDMTGVEDNVLKSLAINKKKMKNFIGATHSNYHNDNPYHNFKHAYSVLTAVGIFLQNGVDAYCTQVDTLALLMASLTHDIGHPGMNNDFFVKKKHELAIRYNDAAVLENMHAALTFEILRMPENNFLCGWNQKDEQYRQFRKHAVAVILATDMKIHFELTSQLQGLKNKELDANSAQEKDLILSSTVHAADLSNPVLPTKIYWCWAYRVVLEFHKQANEEKRLGLPYAPFMEPHPDNEMELAKLQIGFIQFVVEPFWGTFGALFPRLYNFHYSKVHILRISTDAIFVLRYDRVEMLKLNLEIWKTKKAELDKIKEQKDAEEQAALENA